MDDTTVDDTVVDDVVDGAASVAVCTLTSRRLAIQLRAVPDVAMAAPLMTANLGIEQLVRSVLRYPHIRTVLVCGRDSPLFRQGQSLLALASAGVCGADRRIVGADGYQPYLSGLRQSELDLFRSRVRVVDLRGVVDLSTVARRVAELTGEHTNAGVLAGRCTPVEPRFRVLRPGGRRVPIRSAGEGFFVVSVDRADRQVVLRHYWDDFAAGHEMRGRRAESMVLGVIAAGLVTDLGHAGYLAGELMKAEIALRLGLDYEQDIPLGSAAGRMSLGDKEYKNDDAEEDGVPSALSFGLFASYLGDLLGLGDRVVDPDRPLGDQFDVDSARMIELAIALEQECGMTLPDDVDLRRSTPSELFHAGRSHGEGD